MGVGSRASQRRHVRVKTVIEKMVETKLFFLHLLLGFLSAQWWGLPPGFRPQTRLGAQRGLRIPNQAAGSYYAAPTGRNFFRGSSIANYGSSSSSSVRTSSSNDIEREQQQTKNPPTTFSASKISTLRSSGDASGDLNKQRTGASNKEEAGVQNIERAVDSSKEGTSNDEKKGASRLDSSEGWHIPPSLMALAAVPGEPRSAEASIPTDKPQIKKTEKESGVDDDPYEMFMPVPAVPSSARDLQVSRRPKDSLASVDLNVNIVDAKLSKAGIVDLPPSPSPSPSVPKKPLSSELDKKEIRKKFKRCHSPCVQGKCLPVGNLEVYYSCVDKCKQECTP